MEKGTRNLMILYAVVAFLALAGVALNIILVVNLRSLEDPKVTQEVVQIFSKGFLAVALLYLLITLTSLGAIIRRNYTKSLLIILIVALVSVFVFGHFVVDFIVGDTILPTSN